MIAKKALLPAILLLLSAFFVDASMAQLPNRFVQTTDPPSLNLPAPNADVGKTSAEDPLKNAAIPYKPGTRRDPFLNPLLQRKAAQKQEDEELTRGTPPPGIAGTYIAQAVLQGTAIREEGRVAVVRGADTRAYFLKEGDKLFDGYLKTIESDSIILVRETKMKSGKTLTQDVTKRLRTP